MTGSSTQGIKTVLHPVSDLATAKAVYAALLGVPPQTDEPYYVGFEAEGQHIGLVPGGGPQGMTSPVAYWHVPDIEAKLAEVTAAGATVKEPAHDVGGGRLVATVTDPDGNVLGLLQDRWRSDEHGTRTSSRPSRGCTGGNDERKKTTQKSGTTAKGFTAEERAAMKERARELKAEARANKNRADGESDVLAKIAEMHGPDRAMAERLHAIIKASAPALSPKTWYGMPAYAKDGKVVCFFQSAQKFKTRYATFGFNDEANLDEGAMWPTSFALKELTAADEARIGALVKKAVS